MEVHGRQDSKKGDLFSKKAIFDQVREVPGKCIMNVYRLYRGVSKNNGTPKWMVYKGKPY